MNVNERFFSVHNDKKSKGWTYGNYSLVKLNGKASGLQGSIKVGANDQSSGLMIQDYPVAG